MTVGELIKELKSYPKDAIVCYCSDWEAVDEEGQLTDLKVLDNVCSQTHYVDDGLDFSEEHQVIFDFR